MLTSNPYTPAAAARYLQELKAWLAAENQRPPEEMAAFFAARLDSYEAVHRAHWGAEYEQIAAYLPAGVQTLLDIGCGTGLELASLFRRFPALRVTGIDLSAAMLAKLRETYSAPAVETLCADYFQYPFDRRQYDAALSFQTLHHFPAAQKRLLYQKLCRALRPGGCYLECDYVACCPEEEALCLAGYEQRRRAAGIPAGTFVHIDIPLTLDHQRALLRAAGFSAVEVPYQNEGTAILRARR